MRIFSFRNFALAVLLLVLAVAVGVYLSLSSLYERKTLLSEPLNINFSAGMGAKTLSKELAARGVVGSTEMGALAIRLFGGSPAYKAGYYRFTGEVSLRKVVEDIAAGRVFMVDVTFPEGYTARQMASVLESAGVVSAREFMALASSAEGAKKFGLPGPTMEGFLFPDTYRFAPGLPPEKVAGALVARFREVARSSGLEGRGDLLKLVTLASIVEKETGKGSERPLIASVFYNRLKKGMRLESDPTIIYGMDGFDGNIRKKDIRAYSPYNTYVISGLPPGPIANPGRESLKAVLNPAQSGYLYFVAKGDGSHHFSSTLTEHNNAVRRYQLGGRR